MWVWASKISWKLFLMSEFFRHCRFWQQLQLFQEQEANIFSGHDDATYRDREKCQQNRRKNLWPERKRHQWKRKCDWNLKFGGLN